MMLRLNNVTKVFGNRTAVDALSLEIRRGEVFGLLGPNGAGKTTTVNLAVGLLAPDSGAIEIDGTEAPTTSIARKKIGVAPQALALYDDLSGRENVLFFGQLHGLKKSELKDRAAWAIDFVGLTDRARDRAKTYSGGMKRRLNLAIAIVHAPPLLLLDEPTVGVDPQSRNAIFENIQELKERGTSIIYTTHYMEEAERLCDRVGILDQGRLLALDTVENLINKHGGKCIARATTRQKTIRIETDDPLAALASIQEKEAFTSFHLDQPNLEAVFLHLTGRSLRD